MKTPNYQGHSSLADMVSTHIDNWRYALKTLQKCQLSEADVSYFQHELKALADIEAAVNTELENTNES